MATLPANVIRLASLHNRSRAFRERAHAGEILAGMLLPRHYTDAVVLAIPTGGVPVAAVLAQALRLPLDIAVVSKLTLPWKSEAGFGALAFDGTLRLNEALVKQASLSEADIERGRWRAAVSAARHTHRDPGRRRSRFGVHMMVAIEALRHQQAKDIVVAVPTAHSASASCIAGLVEMLYSLNVRKGLRFAVADAYEHWSDVDEETVRQLLEAQAASS